MPNVAGNRTEDELVRLAIERLEHIELAQGEMIRVARIMRRPPFLVLAPHDRLDLALALMRAGRTPHAPVVGPRGLAGVLAERDSLEVAARSLDPPSAILVGEVAEPVRNRAAPGDPASSAGFRLLGSRLVALPVVERGQLVGMLSRSDFFQVLADTPLCPDLLQPRTV